MANTSFDTSNQRIVYLLQAVATVYLLENVNRFRIIAYQKAADTIDQLSRQAYDLWQNGELESLAGVGTIIAEKLDDYFKNGDESQLVKITQKLPASVYLLMKVPGIGPKKAYRLVQEFELENPDTAISDLMKAAEANKIAPLDGFGEKSQSDIIESLKLYTESQASGNSERMLLPTAYTIAEEVMEYMKQSPYLTHIEPLGSLRRFATTIGDIDLAGLGDENDEHKAEILNHFVAFPGTMKIEGKGSSKASIILANGKKVDLRITSKRSYGAMLQYFTGTKAHNIRLREYALKRGLSLSEYAIKEVKTEKIHEFSNEKDFYNFLKLDWVPPELREGNDEVDLAHQHKLPKLVELEEIKGDLHIHSDFDIESSHDVGTSSLEEITSIAKGLSYEYIGLSDHNPSQMGHTDQQIVALMKKRYGWIREFEKSKNAKGLKFFVGVEADIMPNGKVALPEEATDYLDYVVVSIHSSFRQSQKDMTDRVLSALKFPKVKIMGHPTGRKIGSRQEIEADWDKVFEFAASKNIAMEINSWPERLDLPDTLVKKAQTYNVKFTIDTDSHHADQLHNMFYGVSAARRGWAEKHAIMNTNPVLEVQEWLQK